MLGDDIRRARLHQHMRDAGIADAIGLIEVTRVSGNSENGNVAGLRRSLESATEFESVEPGHREIRQHGIRCGGLRLLERLMTVVRFERTESCLAQGFPIERPRSEVVLDDENQRPL